MWSSLEVGDFGHFCRILLYIFAKLHENTSHKKRVSPFLHSGDQFSIQPRSDLGEKWGASLSDWKGGKARILEELVDMPGRLESDDRKASQIAEAQAPRPAAVERAGR